MLNVKIFLFKYEVISGWLTYDLGWIKAELVAECFGVYNWKIT